MAEPLGDDLEPPAAVERQLLVEPPRRDDARERQRHAAAQRGLADQPPRVELDPKLRAGRAREAAANL
jgi:hypothetical protein